MLRSVREDTKRLKDGGFSLYAGHSAVILEVSKIGGKPNIGLLQQSRIDVIGIHVKNNGRISELHSKWNLQDLVIIWMKAMDDLTEQQFLLELVCFHFSYSGV